MSQREARGRQATIKEPVSLSGVGVHSGTRVTLTILPAESGSGIVFRRTDIEGARAYIPARYDLVTETRLGTNLTNRHGVSVATVEHLLAAFAGLGIDNAAVELDAAELPICDGSALDFVRLLDRAGVAFSQHPRGYVRVKRPIEIIEEGKRAALLPADGFVIACEIEFPAKAIGRQSFTMELTPRNFRKELAPARTFGFAHEVEALRKMGLARGGSLGNAIVIGEAGEILNPEPLRFADEFVRHKALDVLGDLALAEGPLIARYEGIRPGHALNNKLLRALFADPSAWELESGGLERRPFAETMGLSAGF
ncbi:MAG: UDP-3-O-acyl-N-acetylglucosamine deacetylase [Alphaproteobacteria bacterium]